MSELIGFQIRPVTVRDATVVARHRAAMFRDMGTLPRELVEEMQAMTGRSLCDAIVRGEYVGWLAVAADEPGGPGNPENIVAGAGVQLRRILPFPGGTDGRVHVASGRQAIALNVYTEPPYRRLGLARALMGRILEWAETDGIDSLVLHAAPAGRPLYESLGFVATNEMVWMGR